MTFQDQSLHPVLTWHSSPSVVLASGQPKQHWVVHSGHVTAASSAPLVGRPGWRTTKLSQTWTVVVSRRRSAGQCSSHALTMKRSLPLLLHTSHAPLALRADDSAMDWTLDHSAAAPDLTCRPRTSPDRHQLKAEILHSSSLKHNQMNPDERPPDKMPTKIPPQRLFPSRSIIIIIYLPKMQVHKNSCKHSCSGKTYQAHNSAYGSLN